MLKPHWIPASVTFLVGAVLGFGLTLAVVLPASAQSFHGVSHESWPAGLELSTVAGQVRVDSSLPHPAYYLDDDNDGEVDVRLEFGPFWYGPDSGAMRPDSGASVTARGLLVETGSMPELIVFELDGVSWRNPVEYGMHGWNGSGSWMSSSDTLTVTGEVLVDTTYFYHHFYLDTDNDSMPEYQLVLGPQWYEPTSGAERPEAGSVITVFGAVSQSQGVQRLIVYELDSLEWLPFGGPASWAGHWMSPGASDSTFAYCVNDSASWIGFPSGFVQNGMGGMHWPDSMFIEFWRIPPDSLPGDGQTGRFAGYFVDVHEPSGSSMMDLGYGDHRGMMSFARNLQLRFHYHDEDLPGGTDDGMQVLEWNREMHQWMSSEHAQVDAATNTVLVTGSNLSTYYSLAASDVATIIEPDAELPAGEVTVYQNFPNPFSGQTEISYQLHQTQHVELVVFDLLGRKVETLVDEVEEAGSHHVMFTDPGGPSGVYLYRLRGSGTTSTRRMLLVR